MPRLLIRSIAEHAEWIEPCAEWWHKQWGGQMGFSPDAARAAIADLTLAGGRQAALIALVEDVPAGSVFLIHHDLESHPHLTPWLAGLFVLPAFRGMGIGQALVSAILAEAAEFHYESVYLYTTISEFYRRQGWTTREVLMLHGVEHEIMVSPVNN